MKKNLLVAFIAALTYNTESAAVSPCENISGNWTSTKPTVFELSKPSTVNQISVQPITPKYSHIWALEQDGCLIYGTNFWTSVQMDDDTGLPLVTGSQLVHGVMTPVGLAVISEKNTTPVPTNAAVKMQFHVTLLDNGDLKVVSDNTNVDGNAILYDGQFVKTAS